MTNTQIKAWAQAAAGKPVGYNPAAKEAFLKGARRLANELVKRLGLATAERKIRRNEGGIAVSGEVNVYTPHMYVCIEQGCCAESFYFRGCDGLGDCGSSMRYPNQFVMFERLAEDPEGELDRLIRFYQQAAAKKE